MTEHDELKKMFNRGVSRRGFLGGGVAAIAASLLSREALARGFGPIVQLDILRQDRPTPTGTLTWLSAEAFTGSWDPTQHMILANLHAEWNAFDRLFELDPATGTFKPGLGLAYEVVPGGLKFTLRQGVKFHNGEPFTAADVKYTLERYTDPANTSGAYFPGLVTVDVIDDYTVKVVTETPLPILNLQALVHILSHKDTPEKLKEGHNGTGPFKYVKYEGESITYEANVDYWQGPPRLQTLVMTYVGDPSTRLAALQKGEADVIDRVPGDHVETIKGAPELQIITGKSSELTYLNFKVSRSDITKNKALRQAFSHCIDRKGIVEGIMSGYAYEPEGILPSAIWPFGAPAGASMPEYDLEKAKAKLAEAGFPEGKGLPEFQVVGVVGFYPNMKEYMEYISAECKKVGIIMKLEIQESAKWQETYFGGKPDCDAIFIGWMNMSPDPDEYLLPFFRGPSSITLVDDKDVNALLVKEGKATAIEERAKIMREEVVPQLTDMCIDIPIVETMNIHAAISKVKGYYLVPNSCFPLWDVSKDESA